MTLKERYRHFKSPASTRPLKIIAASLYSSRTAFVLILIVGVMLAIGIANHSTVSQSVRASNQAAAAAYVPPLDAPERDKPETVAFLGDSYTVGTGTSQKFNRWTTTLSKSRHWLELNYGVSATNFATGSRERMGRPYGDRLTDLIVSQPDIVIVSSAGINLSTDQRPGMESTFLRLREGLPDAKIIAVSPFYWNEVLPERHEVFGQSIKSMVESVGGDYLDIGHPLGKAHPSLLAADGTHPNDAGHDALAEAIDDALQHVLH